MFSGSPRSLEKVGIMVTKTDTVPTPNRQQPAHTDPKSRAHNLREPVVNLVSKAGTPVLTLVAVFSGLHGSQKDLEKMGIHLGPSHL